MAKQTEFTAKARKAIHKRDMESCFFCLRGYHMENACRYGGLQIMHVVPRSQMGLGVEQNGVLGCIGHHSLMDNGNKGLRGEMQAMLEDYMQDIYPGWSREAVTYSKYGNSQVLETLKGSRITQGEHDGFSFLEKKGEDSI
ncbi:hypothetical protein [Eisenbergiella massiliensis]|uniref:HNH endonuclease n=1 Tax=Eisenbergiella massiliensis TaxID=1720294 RepID=A0A3E3J013_9FIRM|nr:hypothetical protein [Eisenbergiella massiliensis]RGE72635.1 hypothetical protein DWY69_07050 [Eisenbergiella massiliensis]